ncbi:hypothetical protein SO802_004070 [Lithocarpus litseifolius]|uniref:Uncharacterized protein n=1 Tax=Lithocarpus litseifolius TaxID=425828 RepID=A0AAW2E7J1_9ROSI
MAISKALIACILISILVFHLVEADQMIVEQHVVQGVSYRLGQTCARGLVGLAVLAAAVFLQALPATVMYAPATPP